MSKAPTKEEIDEIDDIEELKHLREDLKFHLHSIKFDIKHSEEALNMHKTKSAYAFHCRAIEQINKRIGKLKSQAKAEATAFEVEKLKISKEKMAIQYAEKRLNITSNLALYAIFYEKAKFSLDPEIFQQILEASIRAQHGASIGVLKSAPEVHNEYPETL